MEAKREKKGAAPISIMSKPITQEVIDSVPYVTLAIQDINGDEIDLGGSIQLFHKQLLQLAMANGSACEYAVLYNIQSGEAHTIKGSEWCVSLPDQLEKELDQAPANSFVVLHNHPNNSLFSFQDIRSFVAHESLHAISVVGHNGDVHILAKNEDFALLEEAGIVLLEYLKHFEHKTIQQFLREASNFGLSYRCEVNMKL